MFQPRCKTLDERLQSLCTRVTRDFNHLCKTLEGQTVAIATLIQAEPEHYGYFQRRGNQPRRGRKACSGAQKFGRQGGLAGACAIDQQGDKTAFCGGMLDLGDDGRTVL